MNLSDTIKNSGLNSDAPVSTTNRSSALRESNRILEHKILYCEHSNREVNPEVRRLRESLLRDFGVDMFDKKQFPAESINWRKLRTKLFSEMREADATTAFVQFLRAGLQSIVMQMYETVPVTYQDWVTVVASSRAEELYAPNHGVAFPREVAESPSGKYPEVGAAALDIKLRNRKFGAMYNITVELLEDDQTGSFARQSALLGEYMRYVKEVWCYGKLLSVANMKYLDLEIPTSETKPSYESDYPWSTSLRGGGKNRPAAFGALTQANIQDGIVALMSQKNLLGIRMNVLPTRLIIGPKLKFDAHVLLNSAFYPSGAAASGQPGGAFAVNPLQGILDVTVTRFMPSSDGSFTGEAKSWLLVDDSKPWFILQEREPISIVQENPVSGRSFEEDLYRFKARARFNADFIDPRFAWLGNDGSV